MHGGLDTAAGDASGENTEPLPVLAVDTSEVLSSEPLRPLTDLSYDFASARHSPRSWPRFALPRRSPRLRSKRVAVGAASVSAVAVAAAAAWLMWPHGSHEPTPSPTPPAATDGAAELRTLVPAGFADSCQQESATPPVLAQLICTPHSGPSAPTSARFLMAQKTADLQGLLRDSLTGTQVVVCPGNIQSPGPWRRNATPAQVAGTLVCATRGGRALVAWTTDERRLVSVVEGDAQGPSMGQLYTWWTAHS